MQPTTLAAKTLTVRLPPELYSAAQKVARRRDLSLNALLQESLIATIRVAEEEARYEEYSLLGQDRPLCDVDYAIHAQAEVMLGDDLS
jgi:hypothetical protein